MDEQQSNPIPDGPSSPGAAPQPAAPHNGPEYVYQAPAGGNPNPAETPASTSNPPYQPPHPQQPYQSPHMQQPYQPPQPYQPQTQPGQLYGQPPFQGMPPGSPYYTPTPNERPSKATAAATLGIVNGSLGILRAIATFLLLAVVFSNPRIRASAGSSYENTGFMLVSTEAICTLGIALTLLIGGIRFLQGKGRIALLIATFIQLPIVLLETFFIFQGFSNPTTSPGVLTGLLFMQLIGLVLAILMIVFLFNRDVSLWSNRAKALA